MYTVKIEPAEEIGWPREVVKEEIDIGPTQLEPPDMCYNLLPIKDEIVDGGLKNGSLVRESSHGYYLRQRSEPYDYKIEYALPNETISEEKKPECPTEINSQPGNYECDSCSKVFSWKCNLITHMIIHNKKIKNSDLTHKAKNCQRIRSMNNSNNNANLKAHRCLICEKNYSNNNNLQSHLRIHTKEKPYECVACNRRFNEKSNLTTHTKIHTGERPFICAVCSKGFMKKYNLIMHLNVHNETQFNVYCKKIFSSAPFVTSK